MNVDVVGCGVWFAPGGLYKVNVAIFTLVSHIILDSGYDSEVLALTEKLISDLAIELIKAASCNCYPSDRGVHMNVYNDMDEIVRHIHTKYGNTEKNAKLIRHIYAEIDCALNKAHHCGCV